MEVPYDFILHLLGIHVLSAYTLWASSFHSPSVSFSFPLAPCLCLALTMSFFVIHLIRFHCVQLRRFHQWSIHVNASEHKRWTLNQLTTVKFFLRWNERKHIFRVDCENMRRSMHIIKRSNIRRKSWKRTESENTWNNWPNTASVTTTACECVFLHFPL